VPINESHRKHFTRPKPEYFGVVTRSGVILPDCDWPEPMPVSSWFKKRTAGFDLRSRLVCDFAASVVLLLFVPQGANARPKVPNVDIRVR
jgi:hypothetical protein